VELQLSPASSNANPGAPLAEKNIVDGVSGVSKYLEEGGEHDEEHDDEEEEEEEIAEVNSALLQQTLILSAGGGIIDESEGSDEWFSGSGGAWLVLLPLLGGLLVSPLSVMRKCRARIFERLCGGRLRKE
jgi:hypothetical protein